MATKIISGQTVYTIPLSAEGLKDLRHVELRLSQEDLARKLGVSVATVIRWERNGISDAIHSRTARALQKLEDLVTRPKLRFGSCLLIDPQSLRQADFSYAGYEDQVRAAVELGRNAVVHDSPSYALLFGHAGTGKTTFTRVVAKKLNEMGHPVSLLHIPCMELAGNEVQDVRAVLMDIDSTLGSPESYPMLIVLDEIDAVSREGSRHPSEIAVCYWALHMLKLLRSENRPGLVIGVTSDPDACDRTILSEFGPSIFLDLPDRAVLGPILAREGLELAGQIAIELTRQCEVLRTVMTTSSVVESVRQAKKLYADFPSLRPGEIAQLLLSLSPGFAAREAADFRERNHPRIAAANALASIIKDRTRSVAEAEGRRLKSTKANT